MSEARRIIARRAAPRAAPGQHLPGAIVPNAELLRDRIIVALARRQRPAGTGDNQQQRHQDNPDGRRPA